MSGRPFEEGIFSTAQNEEELDTNWLQCFENLDSKATNLIPPRLGANHLYSASELEFCFNIFSTFVDFLKCLNAIATAITAIFRSNGP